MTRAELKQLIAEIIKEQLPQIVAAISRQLLREALQQPKQAMTEQQQFRQIKKARVDPAHAADIYDMQEMPEPEMPQQKPMEFDSRGILKEEASYSSLSGVDPEDPGVDVGNLFGDKIGVWNKLKGK